MKTRTACSLHPYFKIPAENLDSFRRLTVAFTQQARSETKCLHYSFSFNGTTAHCREFYEDAEGVLEHLDNVSEQLGEALRLATLTRLEIHGPEEELAKLQGPMADLSPTYFVVAS